MSENIIKRSLGAKWATRLCPPWWTIPCARRVCRSGPAMYLRANAVKILEEGGGLLLSAGRC